MNKKIIGLFFPLVLSACIVVPARPERVYAPPPAGVVYVAPSYAAPTREYIWEYHTGYGWGWHHPRHGWYHGRR